MRRNAVSPITPLVVVFSVVASTACHSPPEAPAAPTEPAGKALLAGFDRALLECGEVTAPGDQSEFAQQAAAWGSCTTRRLGELTEQRRNRDPSASERLAVTLLGTKPGDVHAKIDWGSSDARAIIYQCLAESFVDLPLRPADSCAAIELRVRTASAE
jgi:hypothetical protein